MGKTSIEWTDKTWSPLRAQIRVDAASIALAKGYTSLVSVAEKMTGHIGPHCESVSHGCDNCYSETNNHRCLPSNGTGLPFDRRSRDLIEPIIDERILIQPLCWREPQRIFVENQSDLFGEWNTDEMIDRVIRIIECCPRHKFQILTKREKRMCKYFELRMRAARITRANECESLHGAFPDFLPNLHLGVSVEDQQTADERIPLLLQTPAAKRFVSYEPALGPVDFEYPESLYGKDGPPMCCSGYDCGCQGKPVEPPLIYGIDQIIVGGESGPGARPFDIAWARQTIQQCKGAGVACFVKQLGAKPRETVYGLNPAGQRTAFDFPFSLTDRKGDDMSEWSPELRVRELI